MATLAHDPQCSQLDNLLAGSIPHEQVVYVYRACAPMLDTKCVLILNNDIGDHKFIITYIIYNKNCHFNLFIKKFNINNICFS